ncbi:TIGR01777 family protein [Desulfovibrio desulfuricans]|jgi:TIGR01777 family protein|uniref:TIGR01777 family protein n=1 Tax=Desulfovibrio desulfuricans TaxID=876 RepID=A0A4P7UKA7_DESDE|nr:TIGR01777 family oxidoreductase [Desulfovibrio desulfuricans]QCC86639.1 TIGR01777 family protein [Desulfovibrio desulfuricans]
MHVLILGGTGFVGRYLAGALLRENHTVSVASRSAGKGGNGPRRVVWNGWDGAALAGLLDSVDAIVNLQGENIGGGRWTAERKQAIVSSRVETGQALCVALRMRREQGHTLPATLLQASASGYYGLWRETAPPCDEGAASGQGFLADTCRQWEQSTVPVEALGLRRCVLRFAPVLGKKANGTPGGFIERMLPPFRMHVGGPLGSGRQPFCWTHLEDVAGAASLLLQRTDLAGAFNICAPRTPSMSEFTRALGRVCGSPSWLPVPGPLLRLLLGQMADELLLAGQNPTPLRLQAAGYAFRQPELEQALQSVLA